MTATAQLTLELSAAADALEGGETPKQSGHDRTKQTYLAKVIRLYLSAPDTPRKASWRDWAIATDLYQQGVPLKTVAHAVRYATLRRHLRDHDLGPLEPIHSLAYYRRVIELFGPLDLDPGWVECVEWKYRDYFPESAAKQPEYGDF